jgi:hypothetical protein
MEIGNLYGFFVFFKLFLIKLLFFEVFYFCTINLENYFKEDFFSQLYFIYRFVPSATFSFEFWCGKTW